MPLYAELQIGETAQLDEHLARGVPDLRLRRLPGVYERFFEPGLPLTDDERDRLRAFAPRFDVLCAELPDLATVDHGDLHIGGDDGTFELALRIGHIAHCFAWFRHRDAMPADFLKQFDEWFPRVLTSAVAQT